MGLSSGFILRLLGGAYVAEVVVTDGFLIIACFGSLFIATCKRSAEKRELGDGECRFDRRWRSTRRATSTSSRRSLRQWSWSCTRSLPWSGSSGTPPGVGVDTDIHHSVHRRLPPLRAPRRAGKGLGARGRHPRRSATRDRWVSSGRHSSGSACMSADPTDGPHRLLYGWGHTSPSSATVMPLDDGPMVLDAIVAVPERGVIGRGLGRAYGDAAQNAGGMVVLGPASTGIISADLEMGDPCACGHVARTAHGVVRAAGGSCRSRREPARSPWA